MSTPQTTGRDGAGVPSAASRDVRDTTRDTNRDPVVAAGGTARDPAALGFAINIVYTEMSEVNIVTTKANCKMFYDVMMLGGSEFGSQHSNQRIEITRKEWENSSSERSCANNQARIRSAKRVSFLIIAYFSLCLILDLLWIRRGTWNVVVGKSFGSFVTHETKT
jgi:hypothetical protein